MFNVELPPNDQPIFEYNTILPEHGEVQHFVHYDDPSPKIAVKLERNSKGFNYEISVTGAKDTNEWKSLLLKAKAEIELIIAQEREVTA